MHGQRIDQREHDEVVLPVCRREIVARIVVDRAHPWIRVRTIGVTFGAEPQDHRIDFDGVDVFGAVAQRRRDVSARARAEDQHIVERVAEDGVRPLIEVFLLVDRRHRLMKDVVHLDHRVGAILEERDAVVGGPQAAAFHLVDDQQ